MGIVYKNQNVLLNGEIVDTIHHAYSETGKLREVGTGKPAGWHVESQEELDGKFIEDHVGEYDWYIPETLPDIIIDPEPEPEPEDEDAEAADYEAALGKLGVS